MVEGGRFELIVFGYRNDVARARIFDFVRQLPPSADGPTPLHRYTPLPHQLFTALERERAEALRSQLEELGAQVALLEVATTPSAQRLIAVPVAKPRPWATFFTLVLMLLLGASMYLWRVTQSQRAVRPSLGALAQVSARLEQLTTHTGQGHASEVPGLNAEAAQLAASGLFRDAERDLRKALALTPTDEVLQRNLQTVLLNWGIADLNAGHLDDATYHLLEASNLGERVEVWHALGVTYARQGNYDLAVPALEHGLRLEPTNANTLLTLADVYLKQDRRAPALEVLQRAKEAGAQGPELDRMLGQLSREVDAEWDFVELQSRHFRVSFGDGEDRRTVKQLLDALEGAYDVVGAKFNYRPDERTPVVLYTQSDFHAVTQTPDWAGAAFDGRIKIPVRGLTADDPNLPRVLRHEYAHSAIAQITAGHCPVWLNEGLAVWAEENEDADHTAWATHRIADNELFALEQLRASFTMLPADRVEVAYAESYLAVRSLIDRYGARKIPVFLAALGRARNVGEAFASVYPGDFPGFEQQLFRQLAG